MRPLYFFLILISIYIAKFTKRKNKEKMQITIPWFAFMFIAVAVFNSFNLVPKNIVTTINGIDTFLLTMSMAALGMETHVNKFKSVGMKPIYLATILFIWLMFGGMGIIIGFTG